MGRIKWGSSSLILLVCKFQARWVNPQPNIENVSRLKNGGNRLCWKTQTLFGKRKKIVGARRYNFSQVSSTIPAANLDFSQMGPTAWHIISPEKPPYVLRFWYLADSKYPFS